MPAEDHRATRQAYDAVAASYARLLPDMSAEEPLDRAVLAAFVEMAEQHGSGLVAEVGCGTGRVTAHLAKDGLPTIGLDLSPGMVAEARAAHPTIAFGVADVAALPLRDGVLGGLVSWYSLINLRPDELPTAIGEFARVTKPNAPVVLAFQCGNGEHVERTTSYEQPVTLTYYRHRIEDVTRALEQAGFAMHATVRREQSRPHETTPQAFLIARRCRPIACRADRPRSAVLSRSTRAAG